jgi:glycosyltransferase 2 family protein
MKNSVRIILVLLITILFLFVALKDLEYSHVWEALRTAQWEYFIAVIGCYLLTHSVRTLRLWVLLDKKCTYISLFSINTIGFLAINVIPLRIGEMVRPYLLLEKEHIAFSKGIAAILLERLLDMLMLLIMLFGLTWFVSLPEKGVLISGVDIISVGQKAIGLMVITGIICGGAMVVFGDKIFPLIKKLPAGESIAAFSQSFREGLSGLFTNPLQALYLLLLSAVVWLITIGAVGFAMAAFSGIPVGIGPAWTVWSITLTGMIVAPTPGFIGVYEVFCAAALWLWGVDHTLATTFALALHFSQLSFTIVMGVFFLVYEGLVLRTVVSASQSLEVEKESNP